MNEINTLNALSIEGVIYPHENIGKIKSDCQYNYETFLMKEAVFKENQSFKINFLEEIKAV